MVIKRLSSNEEARMRHQIGTEGVRQRRRRHPGVEPVATDGSEAGDARAAPPSAK